MAPPDETLLASSPIRPARASPGSGAGAVALRTAAALGLAALAGCDGPQSALDPAGADAERVADLFWWMAGGALLVWLAVVGLSVYAIRVRPQAHSERGANLLILGGGVAFPTVVLCALLAYGLAAMPDLLALPPAGGLRVEVVGERWWWRVRYLLPDGREVELANELRLPVGERVELALLSADVIHSFWVPALAGKIDMIPGRENRMALEPTRVGTFRGACAEYCGASHAWMGLFVVVSERAEFEAWLEGQLAAAAEPRDEGARRGRALFLASGCGACHTVRGSPADGVLGPDLTHVGGRVGLAAARLPNDVDGFARWIALSEELKPGAHMPPFAMLPAGELADLAAYMESLQ